MELDGTYDLCESLVTVAVLRVHDGKDNPINHAILKGNNDPNIFRLLLRVNPQTLSHVALGSMNVPSVHRNIAKNANGPGYKVVKTLLNDSYNAYKQHRYADLEELIGTSHAMELLVAEETREEGDLSLHVL